MNNRVKRDIKMVRVFMIPIVTLSLSANAVTFNEAIKALQTHESIKTVILKDHQSL